MKYQREMIVSNQNSGQNEFTLEEQKNGNTRENLAHRLQLDSFECNQVVLKKDVKKWYHNCLDHREDVFKDNSGNHAAYCSDVGSETGGQSDMVNLQATSTESTNHEDFKVTVDLPGVLKMIFA